MAYLSSETGQAPGVMGLVWCQGRKLPVIYSVPCQGGRASYTQFPGRVDGNRGRDLFISEMSAMSIPSWADCPRNDPNIFLSFLGLEFKDVLEVGSRIVSPGSVSKRPLFEGRHYTGFDLYRDANTDVVGDAHRLSSYFDERFDAIFSLSVLEHLAYPWIFAYEVNKSLKVGGFTFHATHFHWPEHEAPADYFRFSDWGLESLFGPMFGFRVIKSGVFAPAYMDLYDNTKHEGMKDAHCWGGSAILAVKETTPPFFLDSNAVDSFFERIYPKHEST